MKTPIIFIIDDGGIRKHVFDRMCKAFASLAGTVAVVDRKAEEVREALQALLPEFDYELIEDAVLQIRECNLISSTVCYIAEGKQLYQLGTTTSCPIIVRAMLWVFGFY